MHHSSQLLIAPNIRHGFFDCTGGVSSGVYTSLNCGPGSNDNPDHVVENQRRVLQALEVPQARLITLHQIHSPQAITVTEPWAASDTNRPQADAMVTTQKNIALGILTADCCPILFADAEHGVIGAAHAGWRGAFSGIIEATVKAMCDLGATTRTITAAIGPTIQQDSYEVDDDFRIRFIAINPDNKVFFTYGAGPNSYKFDLPAFVKQRLQQAGLKKIDDCVLDTYPPGNNFFSYRRRCHEEPDNKAPDYGRQISVISLHD